MRQLLAELSGRRRLAVAVACSILLHLSLVAIGVIVKRVAPPTFVAKKGDTLFVELPKPEEEAASSGALGAQSTPPAPKALAPAPKPKPPAPKTQARQAPRSAPSMKPSRASEPTQVAKAQPAEPEELRPSPSPPPVASEQAARPPASPEGPADPGVPRGGDAVASLPKAPAPGEAGPGGLQGLRRGRGGIEGDPIPLDTKDPHYSDYFQILKRQIQEKWSYPREAGDRGIGGQLTIDFVIAKNGQLEAIELRRSSGVEILDRYALNAIKLAQPFPPFPDSLGKEKLLIAGIFNYIVNVGFVNQFLR
jgi:protein TonB